MGKVSYEMSDRDWRKIRQKKTLTTGQVAKICKVASRTVAKWIDSGRLKGYRIPGSQDRRVPVENFLQFLKENGLPYHAIDSGQRHQILLVGVDKTILEHVHQHLSENGGHNVQAVNNVFEAGVLAVFLVPDVVVIDFRLGRDIAIQAVQTLRTNLQYQSAFIVGLTSEDEAAPEQLLQYGFNEVFKQPVNVIELVQRIKTWCLQEQYKGGNSHAHLRLS
jgi:excisionase family DNA binding protein